MTGKVLFGPVKIFFYTGPIVQLS